MFMILPWVAKGANLTCTLLCLTLSARQALGDVLPRKWYLQTDMGSENWNATVLCLLGLLVHFGVFAEIHFNRLPVGHTHIDIDAIFGINSVVASALMPRTISQMVKAIYRGMSKPRSRARHKGAVVVRLITAVYDFVGFFQINSDFGGYGADRFKNTSTGDVRKDKLHKDRRMILGGESHTVIFRRKGAEVELTFQANSGPDGGSDKEVVKLSDILDKIPEQDEVPVLLRGLIPEEKRDDAKEKIKKIIKYIQASGADEAKTGAEVYEWNALLQSIPSNTSVDESTRVLDSIRESGAAWEEDNDGDQKTATGLIIGQSDFQWPEGRGEEVDLRERSEREEGMEQAEVGGTVNRVTHAGFTRKDKATNMKAATRKLVRVRRRNAAVRLRMMVSPNGGGDRGGGGGGGGDGKGRREEEDDEDEDELEEQEGHARDNDPVEKGEMVFADVQRTWAPEVYGLRYCLAHVDEVESGDGLNDNSVLQVTWWYTSSRLGYCGFWREWEDTNSVVSRGRIRRGAVVCAGGVKFTSGTAGRRSKCKLSVSSTRAVEALPQGWPMAAAEEDGDENEGEYDREEGEGEEGDSEEDLAMDRAKLKKRSVLRRGLQKCTCSRVSSGAAGSCDSVECVFK
jgi:hypothetical protein